MKRPRQAPVGVRLAVLLAIVGVLTTHPAPGSWNDASRMATVQALVESRTFVIERTAFTHTGDKVLVKGRFYSDKPPTPSILGAIVYLPLHQVGIDLHRGRSLAYYLITLLTVKLAWLLGTLAFFGSLRYTGLAAGRRFLASLALGLGSTYFSFSSTFNNHVLAGAFLSLGLFFLLRARNDGPVGRNLLAAGLFLSLAGACDLPTAIFFLLFGAYVLHDPRLRPCVALYLVPALATVLPVLAIDYAISGSVLPFQIVRSYFLYPGSPWSDSTALSGVHANSASFTLRYAVGVLVGRKGFLLYDPLLVIAIGGLVRTIRRRGTFLAEAVVIALGSILLLLYYLLTTSNYGGFSYSIRWLVPLLPLLFLFLFPFLESFGRRRAWLYGSLLAVSVVIALIGAYDPWSNLHLSPVPLIANLRELAGR